MKQEKQNTALLVMDMQAGILSSYPDAAQLTSNVAKAIASARKNNIKVIYVVVGFRPGAPERKASKDGSNPFAQIDMEAFMKIDPALKLLPDDLIVTKRRFSAFTGSDLEVILRSQDIKHLVLTGYATSGVLLSTYCEAADKDYQLTILSDCCGNADEEVQEVLINKVFPRMATLASVATWSI
ncbi:cysteine hydrolase family protein [Pedobacter sp. WC2423]|uniref:cysteine hydrolase family protein n=1 Tax=Pedobacter sp. WC2423 TaxID=3234142 RepID=UPI003465FFAC